MDDFEIDLFITRVIQRYGPDELLERLGIGTAELVERFREEILDEGYNIFDD